MDLATVDHLLTTTRAVRRRMDFTRPVEPELIDECLEIAIQAPSGSNVQDWHFLVVTDDEPRRAIAGLYERAWKEIAAPRLRDLGADDPQAEAYARVISSATYLAEHINDVPAFVIPCIRRRLEGASLVAQAAGWGSILPAAWSFMLAARSRGLGTVWTTIHLYHEREAASALGVPDDVSQVALIPVAYFTYFTGEDFKPAPRLPLAEVRSRNRWGQAS